VLSDPERRATYDRYGREGLRGGGFAPADFDLGNLSDIFGAFFGESLFGQQARRGGPSRGGDVVASAEITLAEAFTGISLSVPTRVAETCDTCGGNGAAPGTVPVTCDACGGAGRVQQVSQSVFGQFVRTGTCPRCEGLGRVVESPCATCDGIGRTLHDRSVNIDIPAGIADGQRIRLAGRGHAGERGGPAGDLYVLVHVAPDERFVRDGDDLVTVLDVPAPLAALGATLQAPSLDGEVDVDVAAGTQPGSVVTVGGKGMPRLRRPGRHGDLRVVVNVVVPRKLSKEQRRLAQELADSMTAENLRTDESLLGKLKRLLG
jgi:molecular chaperone DnaJ